MIAVIYIYIYFPFNYGSNFMQHNLHNHDVISDVSGTDILTSRMHLNTCLLLRNTFLECS